jgi:hypothetical protein
MSYRFALSGMKHQVPPSTAIWGVVNLNSIRSGASPNAVIRAGMFNSTLNMLELHTYSARVLSNGMWYKCGIRWLECKPLERRVKTKRPPAGATFSLMDVRADTLGSHLVVFDVRVRGVDLALGIVGLKSSRALLYFYFRQR